MSEYEFTIPGEPVGKPRMTRRDQWMIRPAVAAWFAWADVARLSAPALPALPDKVSAIAFFRVSPSWPRRRRELAAGLPHRVRPDVDNIAKALLDALFPKDQVVYEIHVEKRWDDGKGPRMEVTIDRPAAAAERPGPSARGTA